MTLEEKTARKLNFLPREALQELIISHYKGKKAQLGNMIRIQLNKRPRDPFVYISRINQDKLIGIIRGTDISEKEIDESYEEYLYGKNPSLFLRRIKNPEKRAAAQIKNEIPAVFNQVSRELEEVSESKVRNTRYVDFAVSNGTAEIEFKYEARIDYIDPKTEEPDFKYGLKYGIVWISEDQRIEVVP